ncbi:MAG: amidohydrolase family protein [Fimbriimonadaceae bacterium]|nr:amidohydrolase family protein [Chitinophagales bacterium]
MKRICFILFCCVFSTTLFSQTTFPVNGIQDIQDDHYAFTNATIVASPETTIQNGTLIIKKGKIVSVGLNITIPEDAIIIDAKGKFIYASFIDLDADYGINNTENLGTPTNPQINNLRKGAYNWNQAITPEFNAITNFKIDTAKNKMYRSAGFGTVNTFKHDGIARGTSAVVLLGDERENEMIVLAKAAAQFSFRKGNSAQEYPASEMGVIALLRQTLYDMQWYSAGGNREQENISLQAMNDNKMLPQIMEVNDFLQVQRADKIGDEFNFQYIIKANNDCYKRLEEIKKTNVQLIIPITFPKTPDVEDPFDAELIQLADLKHWELAPANAAFLQRENISFAITSAGLENKNDFLKNIRRAIQYGLNDTTALAAITTLPAKMIGVLNEVGTLEKNKIANFIITSGNIFQDETVIYQNWVKGKPYIVNPMFKDIRGEYALNVNNVVYGLLIQGKQYALEFSIVKNTDTIKANGKFTNDNLSLSFTDDKMNYRLNGYTDGINFKGNGFINEVWINWNATFANVYAEKPKEIKKDTIELGKIIYPFIAYGWEIKPAQENILITNANVWTNEKEGNISNCDVLIGNGKILQVGKNISAKNAKVIDGTNKYVTCGIIDEHSHIAASDGVNEGTQAVTSEVRIGDIINSEDINIYRQLSGGVTTSHILHGSANPIGGQTEIIKLRWGLSPEEMKMKEAPEFIKFALGENVKQANWGDVYTVRFPQTRMGVEQTMDDAFTRAEDYMAAKKRTDTLLRKDLELEALAEILMKQRFITCHSYVQSEINMLMHVADKYDFTVNTFTHILEGYKVADKMKAHGAGASNFSDWWAYKYEVYDAIPYNSAILTRMGIITAVNSDDAEMARRLNQEAAKSIKYGGLTEEEAWKLCTLNPAKLLHIDKYVGSIKSGKDADVVIWNNNPLSIYASVEKTFVDGVCYYDSEADTTMQKTIAKERARIIAKMVAAKKAGESTVPIVVKQLPEYHCEDNYDFIKGNFIAD